jgi:hypothetical protein
MRYRIRLLVFAAAGAVLFTGAVSAGQGEGMDAFFRQGNAQYQAGRYETALEAYQKILDAGFESGALYFNMGNCCYKLGRIGRAVLYYERAAKRMPSDEDLKANLALANLAALDRIEAQPEFFPLEAARFLVHLVPRSTLVLLVLVFYVLTVGFLIVRLLGRRPFWRSAGFRGAVAAASALAVCGLLLAGRIRMDKTTREAVVLASKTDARSEPGEQGGIEVFSLHEGAKVRLDRESGEWIEIILPDRKVGWVKKEALGVI